MRWTGQITIAALLLCAGSLPAQAMELCEALEEAPEETRTQISGIVVAAKSDTEYPYVLIRNDAGDCEIYAEAVDKAMLEKCTEGARATAIGVLRWDMEAAFLDDMDVNFLDEANVVCE